ncbi:MAG: SH3 domain-containing protein [Microcoleaceae cyanobacterium]
MLFKLHQLIIAAVAGVATAAGVAYYTIQSQTVLEPFESIAQVVSDPGEPPPSSNPIVIQPPTAGCTIEAAVVDDPAPPLNVRSTPEVLPNNIVGQVENNTFLFVIQQQNGWLKIRQPISGWVAQNLTRSSCARVSQPINFSSDRNQAMIQGEIIGGGSHRYLFEGDANQSLIVESRNSIFPQIITPNGQSLLSDEDLSSDRRVWRGQLPVTGQYTLELNSNFRGFQYDFLVTIE